jgi:hypothetical protein
MTLCRYVCNHRCCADDESSRMIAELQAKLAEKQNNLNDELSGTNNRDEERQQQQREEYARRGISLVAYEAETNSNPYFINLDEDAFRSSRFMYILSKPVTVFGAKGDVQLQSLAVLRDHCRVLVKGRKN